MDEETTLRLTVTASDADPAGLRFTLEPGGPQGAAIDPITGEFSWTPTESQGPSTNEIVVRVTDSGTPKKSSITLFIVRVKEVNRAPSLASLPDRSALVGSLLRITNTVTDPDIHANKFTFALANGAPPTARIFKNGVIAWKPEKTDALTTNRITVVVTDDGVPPLSDSKTINIAVSEFVQLSLGSAIARAGQTGAVSIGIESPVPVMNIQFQLDTDLNRLVSFALRDLSSAVEATSIQQPDPQHLSFAFTLQPTASHAGTVLATLEFRAAANQTSAFVPLRVLDLSARQPSADAVAATLPVDGRVTVIAIESLLEATVSGNGQRSLTLYGVPGSPYVIQSTGNYIDWQTFRQGTLTDFLKPIDVAPSSPAIFYRVVQP